MTRPDRTPVDLTATALRLADQINLWQPLVRYDAEQRYYVRLAAERHYEAWLLTWLPGQGTPWHDHGGSAGAFVVLRGALSERHATVQPDAAPRIVSGSRELSAGSVRRFGTRHLHRVTNVTWDPAVSLHVYAPSLIEMREYTPDGDLLQLSKSQLAGLNW